MIAPPACDKCLQCPSTQVAAMCTSRPRSPCMQRSAAQQRTLWVEGGGEAKCMAQRRPLDAHVAALLVGSVGRGLGIVAGIKGHGAPLGVLVACKATLVEAERVAGALVPIPSRLPLWVAPIAWPAQRAQCEG